MQWQLNGLQLQAISTCVQACMSILAKLLSSDGHGVFQIVLCRSLILLHFAMYLTWKDPHNPFESTRKVLLLLRGLFGFLSISSMYWSLSVMSLQDSMAFLYLAPCLVAAASPIVLGQHVQRATYISIPIAFMGVILVVQPPSLLGSSASGMGFWEISIGMSQAICACIAKLSVSILGTTEPTAHIIASVAIISCLGSLIGSTFLTHDWVFPHTVKDLLYFIGVGMCACLVQFAATLALKRGNAASVMAISYSGIVWSIILDYVVFHTVPNVLGLLGSALITASNLGLVLSERFTDSCLWRDLAS